MDIIFHRYGSICEPDIIEAFQSFGLNVVEEDTEIYQKFIEPSERIRLLSEQILTHQTAFVFSINYFPYISQICEKLQILYVCLSVDCPVLELFSTTIRNKCNRIFLFDYNQYLQFKDENPECIFYLPLGTNVERWDQTLSADNEPGYSYDVSFIGSLYTEKSPYVSLPLSDFDRGFGDGLIEAQLMLSGLGVIEEALTPDLTAAIKRAAPRFHTLPDGFIGTDAYVAANYFLGMQASSLERIRTLNALAKDFQVDLFTRSDISPLKGVRCHDGVSTHTQMPHIFRSSKINLNITIRSIQTGLSQRTWDIMGCQGFLLSNYQMEYPEYFEIGKDLDCYENVKELKEKVAFYLSHDDIRREIALHGYQTVKQKHSCRHRVAEMLRCIYSPEQKSQQSR
ncbi:MAG: DUF3880 domain-containing protein [Suilimivivens sp.]